MKPIRLTNLISFCLLFFISFNSFAKKEEIKLQLFRGQNYTHIITQRSVIQETPGDEPMLNQTITLKIQQKVIEQLGNGNYAMEANFLSFGLERKYDRTVSTYHSDTVDVLNKLYKSLNFLTQIKLNYVLSPEGVVSNLTGFEPIKQRIENDSQLSGLLRSFGSEQFILEFYNYIPLTSVGVGDEWTGTGILPDMMNLKYDIHYTYQEASSKNLQFNTKASFNYLMEVPMPEGTTGNINETGTQKGILLLDPKTRMCLSSEIDQQMEIVLPSHAKEGGEDSPPIKINTRTEMQLLKN